jgi:hypothetical protein
LPIAPGNAVDQMVHDILWNLGAPSIVISGKLKPSRLHVRQQNLLYQKPYKMMFIFVSFNNSIESPLKAIKRVGMRRPLPP